jgi:hypothetical protein
MFIKKGKTNWVMIIVVAIIAGAAGGGSVMYINETISQTTALSQVNELQKPARQNATPTSIEAIPVPSGTGTPQ